MEEYNTTFKEAVAAGHLIGGQFAHERMVALKTLKEKIENQYKQIGVLTTIYNWMFVRLGFILLLLWGVAYGQNKPYVDPLLCDPVNKWITDCNKYHPMGWEVTPSRR